MAPLRTAAGLAAALAALAPTPSTQAAVTAPMDLYGIGSIDGSSGYQGVQLFQINPATGAATPLVRLTLPPNTYSDFQGLTFLNGTLYASDVLTPTGGFGTINLSTGTFTPLNDQNGSLNWQGLTADPVHNVIYTINDNRTGTPPNDVIVGTLESVSPAGAITNGPGTGLSGVPGLAYDTRTSTLYAIDQGGELSTINTTTGAVHDIANTGVSTGAFSGAAIDPATGTFLLNAGSASSTQTGLYRVNTATGATTYIGANHFSDASGADSLSGIAFGPRVSLGQSQSSAILPTTTTPTPSGPLYGFSNVGLLPTTIEPNNYLSPSGLVFTPQENPPAGSVLITREITVYPGDVVQNDGATVVTPSAGNPHPAGIVFPGHGVWVDPLVTSGYLFSMTGGSLFTEIGGFPTGFSAPFDVTAGGKDYGRFAPGQDLFFDGGGVSAFTISGISPTVDGSDPAAFPLQVAFSTASANFTVRPLAPAAVPEPSSFALLSLGLLPVGLLARKRRRSA